MEAKYQFCSTLFHHKLSFLALDILVWSRPLSPCKKTAGVNRGVGKDSSLNFVPPPLLLPSNEGTFERNLLKVYKKPSISKNYLIGSSMHEKKVLLDQVTCRRAKPRFSI